MVKKTVRKYLPATIKELKVTIRAPIDSADFGTFAVHGIAADRRAFEVKGNWDTGAHPEGFFATKFVECHSKFSPKEKRSIRKTIQTAMKSSLAKDFEMAHTLALEDWPVGATDVKKKIGAKRRLKSR